LLAEALRSMATIAAGASRPCTGTGSTSTSASGQRRASTLNTSRTAAPVAEVITPMRRA